MRTGRLNGITKIIIPYFEQDGSRNYSMITLNGTTYASKVYSGIREFVRDNFGIEVDKDWLVNVPLIVNQYDEGLQISDEERQERIEKFIASMELKDDETESLPDPDGKTEDVGEAGESLCAVQDNTDSQ